MKEELECILEQLKIMTHNCEGAMMAGRGGLNLHNFSYSIKECIRNVMINVESLLEQEFINK